MTIEINTKSQPANRCLYDGEIVVAKFVAADSRYQLWACYGTSVFRISGESGLVYVGAASLCLYDVQTIKTLKVEV